MIDFTLKKIGLTPFFEEDDYSFTSCDDAKYINRSAKAFNFFIPVPAGVTFYTLHGQNR